MILPGALVPELFGGVRAAARALGCDASQVSRWRSSGRIPAWWQERVLAAAWQRGLDVTAHDLVMGRVVGR